MLFIGPNDLACSMGNGAKNHMDCPEVQDAIEVIRVAAEKAGKLSGIFCISAEQAAARFAQGFQLINIGGDSECIDLTHHLGPSAEQTSLVFQSSPSKGGVSPVYRIHLESRSRTDADGSRLFTSVGSTLHQANALTSA